MFLAANAINPIHYSHLNSLLSYSYKSEEDWEDEFPFGLGIIQKFKSDDWQMLDLQLSKKDAVWKRRLAQVLEVDLCEEAVEVLEILVKEKDERVVEQARRSLEIFEG